MVVLGALAILAGNMNACILWCIPMTALAGSLGNRDTMDVLKVLNKVPASHDESITCAG